MASRVRRVAAVVLAIIAAVAALIYILKGCDRKGGSARPVGEDVPPGWVAPTVERTSPWQRKLLPGHRETKADKLLKDWPSGTRIVEVGPSEEPTLVAVTPSGDLVAEEDTTNVVIFEKPRPAAELEARPFIGAGGGLGGAAAVAGVHLLRIAKIHAGIGVSYDYNRNFAGVMTSSVNVWRNVDLYVAGGYGVKGRTALFGAAIALE